MAFDRAILAVALAVTAPVQSAATLKDFEDVLARHDSATVALKEWCEARGIARPARIVARKLGGADEVPAAAIRRHLGLRPHDQVTMRNVELRCGPSVLSVAWNWYVPARIPAAMNEALRTTDTPFGKVVAPLGFRRRALDTKAGAKETCPNGTISTHRAMLFLPDGRPLAYLVECYTAANLDPVLDR